MIFGNKTPLSERQYRSRKNQTFPNKCKSKVNKNLSNNTEFTAEMLIPKYSKAYYLSEHRGLLFPQYFSQEMRFLPI